MQYRKLIVIIFAVLLTAGCGGRRARLQVLAPEKEIVPIHGLPAKFVAETVIDTLVPTGRTKAEGVVRIDPANPPVVLDFTGQLPEKKFDLADYYSDTEFIILKHPQASDGAMFLDGINVKTEIYNPYGSWYFHSDNEFSTRAHLAGERIVAGDEYSGYYCFDLSGKYLYTLFAPETLPDKPDLYIKRDIRQPGKWLANMGIKGEKVVLAVMNGYEEEDSGIEIHDTRLQSVLRRPVYSNPDKTWLIDEKHMMKQIYSIGYTPTGAPYMEVMEIMRGDTVALFKNENVHVEHAHGQPYNPGDFGNAYYFGGDVYLRQAYTNTICRLSPTALTPVYELEFGDRQLDMEKDFAGSKEGKIIPFGTLETEDFIMFHLRYGDDNHTENPFYVLYDKNAGRLYRVADEDNSMGAYISHADNVISMPVPAYTPGALYNSLTPKQLKGIIEGEGFKMLPKGQQDRIKSAYDNLGKGEILLMINRRK